MQSKTFSRFAEMASHPAQRARITIMLMLKPNFVGNIPVQLIPSQAKIVTFRFRFPSL
jgi:hypothetical protein